MVLELKLFFLPGRPHLSLPDGGEDEPPSFASADSLAIFSFSCVRQDAKLFRLFALQLRFLFSFSPLSFFHHVLVRAATSSQEDTRELLVPIKE